MDLDDREHAGPAQLQFWPAHAHPTGPGAWDHPRAFPTLREAIAAAITDTTPHAHVAWILTSGGRMLKPADVEDLWLQMQARPATD
jgi:hypothetical protein